jgi:amino acid adenylation domain-containing protein
MNRQNIEDLYPLSPLQQGMLFHALYAPHAGAYLEQITVELEGVVEPEPFRRAWQTVVDRHGALRTAFVWEKVPKPLQVVFRQVQVPVDFEDWRGADADEVTRRIDAHEAAERAAGMDLQKPPLLRVRVVRTGERTHTLLMCFHHLLLDGWSLPLVVQEAMYFYEAYRTGRGDDPPRPRPYRDYIAWLGTQDVAQAEAFWREALAGVTHGTALGVEKAPPAAGVPAAEEHAFLERIVAEPVVDGLKALARRGKLTVNTLVQTAWGVVLSRHSGHDDVVFGVTMSGRPVELEGVDGMVGMFINTLPVRVKVDPRGTVRALLEAVHAHLTDVRQFQYTPLVDVQQWAGVPRDQALFESLTVYENYPLDREMEMEDGDPPALEIVGGRSFERTNYPVSLVVAPDEGRMALRMAYDTRRIDAAVAERVLGHYATLIENLAAALDGPVSAWEMADGAELRAVTETWTGGASAFPRDASLPALFAAPASATPHASALEFDDARLTYAELDAAANRVAHRLLALGLRPEGRVGLAVERSAGLVVAMLGILKAGGAYVPMDPAYPAERLAFMAADAGITHLVTQAALRSALPTEGVGVVSLDEDAAALAALPSGDPGVRVPAEALAAVLYTSGSTGRPKGIALPHRAIVRLVRENPYSLLDASVRMAQASNTSFDAASFEIWGALLNGGTLVGIPRHVALAPETFAAALRERRIDTSVMTTTQFNQVAHEVPTAFAGMRHLLIGGEALDPASIRRVLRHGAPGRVTNGYGPAECATFAVTHPIADVPEGARSIPIGRPIANTTAYVLDGEMRPVAIGVLGELFLGGDGLARGYLNRPALTAERFVPSPFVGGERLYRTGDLCRWNEDGTIDYAGRADTQVKVRGHRIEPLEIEAVLTSLPGVGAAAVAVHGQGGDRRLVGYVVADDPAAADGAALRAALRTTLPDYMVPTAFLFLDALPLTPNGKLDRKALPAPDGAASAAPAYVEPRTETEAAVAAAFAGVLGLPRVGADDDFFSIGGHSLRATQVVGRLRETTGADVPLRDLFECPTPALLAARLDARRDEELARLMAELEGMSDDDARALLESHEA